jgi:hypothetical protein
MSKTIHVGDVGTDLNARVFEHGDPVDVSSATVITFKLTAPDKTVKEMAGTFVNNGTDGRLIYETIAGDIDQHGTWYISVYIEMTGWSGHSERKPFTVKAIPPA